MGLDNTSARNTYLSNKGWHIGCFLSKSQASKGGSPLFLQVPDRGEPLEDIEGSTIPFSGYGFL
jgi:hypothetical protein